MSFLSVIFAILMTVPVALILVSLARLASGVGRQAVASEDLPATQLSGDFYVSRDLLESSGNAVFVGASGCGKTALFERLRFPAQTCVVRLVLAEDIPGWACAPLLGSFVPAGSTVTEEMELPEVLRDRPAGTFRLELPGSVLASQTPTADLLRTALDEEMRKLMQPGDAGPASTKLVVLVDDSEHILTAVALRSFARFGRAINCSLAVFRQSLPGLDAEFLANTRLRGAFRATAAHTADAEHALGLTPGSLTEIERGRFWYCNTVTGTTKQLGLVLGDPAAGGSSGPAR